MSEWISVKDSLPMDRDYDPDCSINVLTADENGVIDISFYAWDVEFWCTGVGNEVDNRITHWRPLPTPPAE